MKEQLFNSILVSIVGCVCLTTQVAIAENNTSTYYTNGIVNPVAGDVYVGNTGTNNYLEVSNATTLTNSGAAYLSYAATANHGNLAVVSGAGSAWDVGSYFWIGTFGTDSKLVITNGGKVSSGSYAYIGYYYDYVSNNIVQVTGTDSTFKLGGGLSYVGLNGRHNQLIIENGGTVSNLGAMSIGSTISTNNTLLVTGTGSSYVQPANDFVMNGTNNHIIVSDGGKILSANLRMYAGANHDVIVTNGGFVRTGGISVGETAGSYGHRFLVTGTGSTVTNSGSTTVGSSGANATLRIEKGASYTNAGSTSIGVSAGGSNNLMIVTDAGSKYKNGGDFSLGGGGSNTLLITDGATVDTSNFQFSGKNNQIIITNGGTASTVATLIGNTPGAISNRVVVTGTGSVLSASYTGYSLIVGYGGASYSKLQIEDGGLMNNAGPVYMGGFSGSTSHSNSILVTGAGSRLNVTGALYFAYGDLAGTPSAGNQITVSDGAQMTVLGGTFEGLGNGGAKSNVITVTGAGSVYNNTVGDFAPNYAGVGNQFIITNGGKVMSANGRIGWGGGSGGLVKITGSGSIWTNAGGLYVGEATNANNNTLIVENGGQLRATIVHPGYGAGSTGNKLQSTSGGVVEANALTAGAGAGNSISNVNGIYQFTAAPTITPNGFGRIAITDGTISYRDFATANIADANVANIAFAGNNTFRLLNSSNTAVATYNFDSVVNTGNPANYQRLALVDGGSRWQGTTLNIGSGGALLVSNANNAVVAAVLNSTGSISVVNSKVTYNSAVGIHGSYISDPSTNTFLADATVGVSGTLAGGAGDLFDFKKSLYIHATNNIGFNLASSAVEFSGGGVHTNALTGDDLGSGPSAFDIAFAYEKNFAYGELHIQSAADSICFECGDIPLAPSNALYVGWLDLLNSTNLVANLHAPGTINVYYSFFDTRNAYLAGQTYQLLDCNGALGGFLMPVIPEPSTMSIVLLGIAPFVIRRRSDRSKS